MSNIVNLHIPAIKCMGCVAAIEKALSYTNGIYNAEVYLEIKTAVIDSDLAIETLTGILKSAGFDALPVDSIEMEVTV